MFLAGVFLDDTEPADPAPSRLDVTNYNTLGTIQPALRQTFFIGDGLTAASARQDFIVPAGATRLYLGVVDAAGFQGGPCCYDDNVGSISVSYEIGAPGGGGGGGGGTPSLSISLSPSTSSSASGLQHTVTASVVDQTGASQQNVSVTFTILSGPNQGATGVCNPVGCKTGANGQVTFTYTGTGGAGTDSITACINTGTTSSDACCTGGKVASDPQPTMILRTASSVLRLATRAATSSSKVVIIGAATVDANCASGANLIKNGGCLPVSGATTEIGQFTFAGLAPTAVTAAALATYDTAVLNVASSGIACDLSKLTTQAKTDLVSFVAGGKKLIIYDSECEGASGKGMDYSWLPYPFTTANPGAMGAQGTLNIVENSTLGSAVTATPITSTRRI